MLQNCIRLRSSSIYFKADGSAGAFPLSLRIMINCMVVVKIAQEQDRILFFANTTKLHLGLGGVIYNIFLSDLKKLDSV